MRRLVLAALLTIGCGHSTPWISKVPPPVEQQGAPARVRVEEVWSKGDRLWVHVHVANATMEPIEIDRDAIVLVFPDGRRMQRRRSSGKSVLQVAPGRGETINVDFEDGAVDWPHQPPLGIDFSVAVTTQKQGAPVPMPKIWVQPGR